MSVLNEIQIPYKECGRYSSGNTYNGVSESFQTESITKQQQTLIEKQHKVLWQQNSLD
jgi:hypothetical protein